VRNFGKLLATHANPIASPLTIRRAARSLRSKRNPITEQSFWNPIAEQSFWMNLSAWVNPCPSDPPAPIELFPKPMQNFARPDGGQKAT
jgi:hypothetical protein